MSEAQLQLENKLLAEKVEQLEDEVTCLLAELNDLRRRLRYESV